MKKRDDTLISTISRREYERITAKLAYVRLSGEDTSFRADWKVPRFKNPFEMDAWKAENIYADKVRASSYQVRLERVANLPQVSLKPEELHYLEYFLLMGELPAVIVSRHSPKKAYGLNRKWETASLFIRLDEKVAKGAKFPKLAEEYSKMMPEQVRKKYGDIKPSKLRKAHSRGKVKANYPKKLY